MLWRLIQSLAGRRREAAAQSGQSPQSAHAHEDPTLARARALERSGELDRAIECYREYVASRPTDLLARIELANALSYAWRCDESLNACADLVELSDGEPHVFSSLLLYSHYAGEPNERALFEVHRRYGQRVAAVSPPREIETDPEPHRRLRVGYLSRDFRCHSVADFVEPVIVRHDREHFTVCCYYANTESDDVTARFAHSADEWHEVADEDDDALAQRIRNDRIDILVDLGGHTKLNRLGVFARRAAPLQVSWLGYPDTTGLATMDYRVTDAIADPPGAEARHTERLLRLEPPFVSYAPPRESPALRSARREGIAFGSFNMIMKVNAPLIALWARILNAVPASRMVMKSALLQHADTARRIAAEFARCGIGAERLELKAWIGSRVEHLAAYHDVDIALDTFPYNGTTTTCEALWMGVPVVTRRGELHMSRVGASLLTAAGLESLVAADADEYVDRAVALARDRERRAALSQSMRERLARSPLLDHAGFTRRLERTFRDIWIEWCGVHARAKRPGAA